MSLASTTSTITVPNTGKDSEKILQGRDGTASTKKGYTSLGWSMLLISKRADWVLLARNNSTGLKKTSKACRPVRRLSFSRIFYCRLSILNGDGEPMMPSEHSPLLSVSG